jgi:transcription elongation GreA/GreB family factor
MVIDFESKNGHGMALAFAAQSLKPIPKDHVIARKMSDLGNLRQMAALHHLDLIKLVLQSYEGQATLDQIQKVLVPDVIADDWKKWWEVARREMKKDGRFQIPTKKTDPIVFSAEGASIQDRLLEDFRAAKGLKAKLHVAAEIEKNSAELSDKAAAGNAVVAALNADITSHQRTMPALALEGIFVRNEIRKLTGADAQAGELDAVEIWNQGGKLGEILEALPASRHRLALESFKAANPNLWSDGVFGLLNSASTKVVGVLAEMLSDNGQFTQLKEHLQRLISQHQASSELLLWLARERSDQYADILGPEVFRAMLTAIERDQFMEKKSNKLRDYILNDQALIVDLIGAADIEVIKDLTRALQLSPVFDDMDKRSLLARIVKNYPAVQSLITGEQSKQDTSLIVSWDSLQRRKTEYEDLVKVKIPANSKDIALARSYGDLRENHEYKSAKEMQKVLMRRKSELERDLGRARGTDFANPRTDIVSIGTHVTLNDTASGATEQFTILGAWDGDPDKHIISYLTPVGQALLNQPLNSEAVVEMDGVTKRYRITGIEPAKSLPPVPQPA